MKNPFAPGAGYGAGLTIPTLQFITAISAASSKILWASRLPADRLAVKASRTMTLAVACVSLLVAAIGMGRMASGWMDGLLEGRELAIGLSVVVLIGLSYLVACRVAPTAETARVRS